MPEQKELPISDLELLYVNGQEHGAPPVFKRVQLSRESEKVCQDEFDRLNYWNKRLRSRDELNRCVTARKEVQHRENQLKWLLKAERIPWVHILSQIDGAIEAWLAKFIELKDRLRNRVEEWESQEREGAKKEQERLTREATEAQLKSQIHPDPRVRTQAADEAKQKKQAAKEAKPQLLTLLAIVSLSLASARADQYLYDAEIGQGTITLKDDGSLWGWHSSDNSEKILGYLKGSVIYDRRHEVDRRHSEVIGYRKGNVLYATDGHVIAYFKKTNARAH